METLNDLQLSSSAKTTGSSQELQGKLLAQLNMPLQNGTRTRNPLSKFTITSPSCHSHASQNPIPAYRTFAQERLPTLTPEDKMKLNISPVSGMPYYISSTANQSRSNSSMAALKTRRCILRKKTIHRSLEDLRSPSAKRNHPSSDHLISPRSRKDSSSCLGDSFFPTHVLKKVCKKQNRTMNQKLFHASPEYFLCQTKKFNSQLQTDNSFVNNNKTQEEHRNIVGDERGRGGPDGDFIVHISNKTNEEEAERKLRNLSIENELLKDRIKEERRKCIFYQIVNAFAFEALRRRSNQLDMVEQSLVQRREECAARIILHHLLLNSWKMTKCQATAIKMENAQMHKTIDNQSLQLNVIRKMQSIEKEKTLSVLKDYTDTKRNYVQTIKENESMREEYAKVLEEKRSLELHLRSFSDENFRLNTDLQIRLDKKEMQLRSMELDRFRAEKFYKENEMLAKETEVARTQIKELTTQRTHWQEKALGYESKCYELKQEMKSKETAYESVLCEKKHVSKENEMLMLSKSKLEKAVEEAQVKLVESREQKKQLEKSYSECKEELEDLEDQVEYLQSALRQFKKENKEIRQKLYDCTLKNVKRRRVWGAALYFLVNPIEAFKRLYFGTPEGMQPSCATNLVVKRKPATSPEARKQEKVEPYSF